MRFQAERNCLSLISRNVRAGDVTAVGIMIDGPQVIRLKLKLVVFLAYHFYHENYTFSPRHRKQCSAEGQLLSPIFLLFDTCKMH
jgi:hypothetical protein